MVAARNLLLTHPSRRDLRVGEGRAGVERLGCACRQPGECAALCHPAPLGVGRVSEGRGGCHVADRRDAWDIRAPIAVGGDALARGKLHPGNLQTQLFDIAFAPNSNQHVIHAIQSNLLAILLNE